MFLENKQNPQKIHLKELILSELAGWEPAALPKMNFLVGTFQEFCSNQKLTLFKL